MHLAKHNRLYLVALSVTEVYLYFMAIENSYLHVKISMLAYKFPKFPVVKLQCMKIPGISPRNSWWAKSREFLLGIRYRDVSFPCTFVPGNETAYSNICSHKLSSPTTVTLLGRRPTRYSICTIMSLNYRGL